jgi:hypothetical protein
VIRYLIFLRDKSEAATLDDADGLALCWDTP